MGKGRNVRVISEKPSGLNTRFIDQSTGREMTRGQFADSIESGNYPDYHVRRVGRLRVPASNPNGRNGDNLG